MARKAADPTNGKENYPVTVSLVMVSEKRRKTYNGNYAPICACKSVRFLGTLSVSEGFYKCDKSY